MLLKKIKILKRIAHPKTLILLSVGQTLVVDVKNNYWLRRLKDEDITIVEDKKRKTTKQKQKR